MAAMTAMNIVSSRWEGPTYEPVCDTGRDAVFYRIKLEVEGGVIDPRRKGRQAVDSSVIGRRTTLSR